MADESAGIASQEFADGLELIREMNQANQQPIGANEVVKDWLIGHGRLSIEALDEESETKGNA